jgi:hypothetical protein
MKTLLLSSVASLIAAACLFAQGPLTPPGAPAPTMKTLDQVEARTPISTAPFTVSASGSYYLTANLAVTSGNAITISADDVTLDLNGFTISSTASPADGAGVSLAGARSNVTVRNGHIRGTTTFDGGTFTTGGFLDGIDANTNGGANLRFSDLSVLGVGDAGINTILNNPASDHRIERCMVGVCAGTGLRAGTVSDCRVDTAGLTAIAADVVINCYGKSVGTVGGSHAISAISVVENSRGIADAGLGISAGTAKVHNSYGTSVSSTGISSRCASNCDGISTSGVGLAGTSVINCTGESASGFYGISASIVSFSRGRRDGGTAISATNAIGCVVVGTGTVSAVNKSLGTP